MHEMTVNTLNFCAFAHCLVPSPVPSSARPPALLAVPHTLDSEAIDVHVLPSTVRRAVIAAPKLAAPATGLAMALSFVSPTVLAAGYESGHVLAFAQQPIPDDGVGGAGAAWHCIYRSRPHAQPVLSLAAYADSVTFLSSAADAVLAKHCIPSAAQLAATSAVEGGKASDEG